MRLSGQGMKMNLISVVKMFFGERGAVVLRLQAAVPGQIIRKSFLLSTVNRCGAVMVSYLQSRGIDVYIISQYIDIGILHKSSPLQNDIFVGRNLVRKPLYAYQRELMGSLISTSEEVTIISSP